MNAPLPIDTAFSAGSLYRPVLERLGLVISVLIALIFMVYLLRCYFQEFRRHQRVRRRKRLARLKSSPFKISRDAVIESCRRRRDLLMREAARLLPAVDWRGLHCLFPAKDRVTLVWDNARDHHADLPRVHATTEASAQPSLTRKVPPLVHEQTN